MCAVTVGPHILKTKLYRGDFCSEDLYEDWCFPEREELKGEYVKALVNISTEHLRRGEDNAALACLERAISMDPGREELYRKQMIIHSQMAQSRGRSGCLQEVRKAPAGELRSLPLPRNCGTLRQAAEAIKATQALFSLLVGPGPMRWYPGVLFTEKKVLTMVCQR